MTCNASKLIISGEDHHIFGNVAGAEEPHDDSGEFDGTSDEYYTSSPDSARFTATDDLIDMPNVSQQSLDELFDGERLDNVRDICMHGNRISDIRILINRE
jgi:hypothetical protein